METTILNTILSENGIVAMLFLVVLYGLYQVTKWFLGKYLDMSEKHNKSFLSSFDKMVDRVGDLAHNVIEGNSKHSDEHKEIIKSLDNNNITNQKINDSISILHKDMKDFHSSIQINK